MVRFHAVRRFGGRTQLQVVYKRLRGYLLANIIITLNNIDNYRVKGGGTRLISNLEMASDSPTRYHATPLALGGLGRLHSLNILLPG